MLHYSSSLLHYNPILQQVSPLLHYRPILLYVGPLAHDRPSLLASLSLTSLLLRFSLH